VDRHGIGAIAVDLIILLLEMAVADPNQLGLHFWSILVHLNDEAAKRKKLYRRYALTRPDKTEPQSILRKH